MDDGVWMVLGLVVLGGVVGYRIYTMFRVRVELRGVPRVSTVQMLMSMARGEPFDQRHHRLVQPVLSGAAADGGVARFWSQGGWELLISDVAMAHLIITRNDVFLKRSADDPQSHRLLARRLMGMTNIAISDHHEWKRHRRVANPAFKKTWQPSMFAECLEEVFNSIDQRGPAPFQVHNLMQHLTLDAMGRGLFSHHFNAVRLGEAGCRFLSLYNHLIQAMFHPVYLTLPALEDWVPSRQESHRKSREFRQFLGTLVHQRKREIQDGTPRDDLLSLIIQASLAQAKEEEGGTTLSDEEVISDLGLFFVAGHDTTANTLATALFYLAKFPAVQDRCRAEAQAILGDARVPTLDQLRRMPYLDAVIKETMRLVPSVPQLRRYCSADTTMANGFVIPRGTFVNVQLMSLHRDATVYPDPHRFHPDRWLDPQAQYGPMDSHWMAFGGGARKCVGLNFSLVEQRTVITMLLQRYCIHPGPHTKANLQPKLNSFGLLYPQDMDVQFIPYS